MKQEIAERIKDNLKALKNLKENGHTVGKLKPKKFINSIPLKQYGITYYLDVSRNRVRIQKLGEFRVLGLHQIPEEAEIASAVLVRKPDGYYLHVTCYLYTQIRKDRKGRTKPINLKLNRPVAIDFGVRDKLTLSNGMKIDFGVRESKRLKRLQRRIARAKKNSKNRRKLKALLRREYQKIVNRRKDAQNKVLAFLRLYEAVIFQDDCVNGWTALFGAQVQSSGIGGLKSRLRNSLEYVFYLLETPIPLERFEPTTSECFVCGKKKKVSLSERTFRCECGWEADRDYNASLVMLRKGLAPEETLPPDWREVTPAERIASARILGSNPHIRVSYLAEAGSPRLQ